MQLESRALIDDHGHHQDHQDDQRRRDDERRRQQVQQEEEEPPHRRHRRRQQYAAAVLGQSGAGHRVVAAGRHGAPVPPRRARINGGPRVTIAGGGASRGWRGRVLPQARHVPGAPGARAPHPHPVGRFRPRGPLRPLPLRLLQLVRRPRHLPPGHGPGPGARHHRQTRRAPRPPLLRRAQAQAHLRPDDEPVPQRRRAQGPRLSAWRRKVRSVVPREGVVVEHIRTGEPVRVSRKVVAAFLLMTVADFSDQYTDYQDELFGNEDGRLEFRGDRWEALWPGTGKPGLWVAAMSRVAALYGLVARDEQLIVLEEENKEMLEEEEEEDDVAVGELVIPPVFERCTRVLDAGEQKAARDLYWEAITNSSSRKHKDLDLEALLRESIGRNPFVGEPHLVLAQVLLNNNKGGGERSYKDAAREAARGVRLLLEWGSSWDKRMSWEGWVSWGRLMGDKARRQGKWPNTAWGIINLGLVQGVDNRN